ncbi:MAG: hypothetical protein EHM70_14040 [Chloroflexota bacterium]|nr:MAG: hypothetical protein EHM70_14040 [Chloroflexota bacterium]
MKASSTQAALHPAGRSKAVEALLALVFLLSLGLFPWLALGPLGGTIVSPLLRVLVFALVAAGGAACLRALWPGRSLAFCALASVLINAGVYRLAAFIPELSTYPLSLGWSEASRFYYASLFFSKQVYGIEAPPSVLHPTRYLMQSVPFLLSASPLWLHRLWQVLLWAVFTLLVSVAVAKRLELPGRLERLLLIVWAGLFLLQGPVYYHLLVMPLVVLLGFDQRRFWRSLVVVLVASLWAGLSRINWLPVPGMLAATIYLLEVKQGERPVWKYLLPPAAWLLLGTAAGWISQEAYKLWSGNPPELFGSSFSSDLLWYRLFPSRTYLLGVLPAAVLVSAPVLLAVIFRLYRKWRNYHPVRLLGLAGMLFVLFAGGVVVSAKIGGGSNLHNLDAYLVLLLVTGSWVAFGRFREDTPQTETPRPIPGSLAWLAVAAPVLFAVTTAGPLQMRPVNQAQAAIERLQALSTETVQSGQEVLFISERQLLTFDTLKGVPLAPDYEKVFLMEMAMSANRAYLDQFHSDLRTRRFGLIVTHPLRIQYQGRSHQFGEENDAWVQHVSEPVLCYYEVAEDFPGLELQVLKPKANPGDCP